MPLSYDSVKIMPQPIGLVITKASKINFCPVNWQVVSTQYETPLTVCIGLSNEHYTLEAIRTSQEFVYSYPSRKHLRDTIYCGTVSGHNIDKSANTSFELFDSDKVKAPCLKDAVLNYECSLEQTIEFENYSIVIGRVLTVHESNLDPLEKIYALGGQKYGVISETETLIDGRENVKG